MQTALEIRNFLDCPSALPAVAKWILEEWYLDKPEHTIETMLARMHKAKREEIPIGLVAFNTPFPVGTVSLFECDLPERKDLKPWLSGLYVVPHFRGLGVGSALTAACVEQAAKLGHAKLYLYTKIPAYYERLGWSTIGDSASKPGCAIMEIAVHFKKCGQV